MRIGIVGLGYVGLPLAVAFAEAGHEVVGVDTDARLVEGLSRSQSHIEDVSSERLAAVADRFHSTTRYADLAKEEAVVIAVPTPLTRNAPGTYDRAPPGRPTGRGSRSRADAPSRRRSSS